jgi:hypothetical protein
LNGGASPFQGDPALRIPWIYPPAVEEKDKEEKEAEK